MHKRSPQKAAFVATIYRHLEAFHLPFMELLQDKGIEVHAYARADRGKKKVEDCGVICHDINFQRSPYRAENIIALKELVSGFKKEGFQAVHLNTPVAGGLGRLAARITGVPAVIYTAHGFHFFKGAPFLNWLLYYPLERIMAHWTDYLVTINKEDFERARKFAVRGEAVYVPGVGIDTELYHAEDQLTVRRNLRNNLGIDDEDFVILCIGELNANKNQIQLLKAVERMLAAGRPVKCLLVGSGHNECLNTYVTERSLELNVQFLGFRRDIADLLAAVDVVAHVSKREGLPRSLMEAMAGGKPVVATDVRGNRDLVVEGETGFLVPVSDVAATVNALVRIADNPTLRAEMGAKSREHVLNYDIRNIIKHMESIYDLSLGDIMENKNSIEN